MAKFRKWNSPAFNEGELWVSSSGVKVRIISVSKHPAAKVIILAAMKLHTMLMQRSVIKFIQKIVGISK